MELINSNREFAKLIHVQCTVYVVSKYAKLVVK